MMKVTYLVAETWRVRRVALFIPAGVALFVGLWSIEDDGLKSIWLYLVLAAIVVFQFFRPTILGWWLCFLPFLGYAIAIFCTRDPEVYSMGFVLGVLPGVALLVAYPWPKREERIPTAPNAAGPK
jgi:hypothetical protein